jgi:ATP-dependent RNA helicase DbpA
LSVASLHGDLEQFDRDRVMAKFRNGSTRILIATDVAARGIDVQDLDLVVNFELPPQPEIYVHRIGRTGRAGKSGLAVSLCAAIERQKLSVIERLIGTSLERMTRTAVETSAPSTTPSPARAAAMVTLRIAGGRKAKLRPGDILGALTGEAAGLRAEDVGKIEIHDRFTYVAVAGAVSAVAQERLNAGRIKGKRYRTTFVK